MQTEARHVAIVRWIILGGLAFVPFLSLEVTWFLPFPMVTGRNFTFRVLIEVLLGLWVVLCMLDRRFLPRWSPILLAYVLFVLVIGLADIFGANPQLSLWSNFERMDGWVNLLHVCAYVFLLLAMLRQIDWRRYLLVFLVASATQMAIGALQVIGVLKVLQGQRIDAFLGNSTYFAAYLVFTIGFAVLVASQNRQIWVRALAIAQAVCVFVLIFWTGSRGALLALMAGALVLGIILLIGGSKRQRLVIAAVFGVFIILIAGFLVAREVPAIQNHPALGRFTAITIPGLLRENRLQLWAMAGQGFLDRPVLGWGQENFPLVFDKYFDPSLYGQEAWFDRAHNFFMDWLVAGGLLGLLAVLSIFVVALALLWRRIGSSGFNFTQGGIITAMIVAYLVQNLFLFDSLASYTWFAMILGLIQCHSQPDWAWDKREPAIPKGRPWLVATSLVTGLVLAGTLYLVNIRPVLAGIDLIQAGLFNNASAESLQANLAKYKSALAYGGLGNPEIRENLLQKTIMLNQAGQIDPAIKQQFVFLTQTEITKQVMEAPLSAKNRWQQGSFYMMVGKPDAAIESFKESLRLSPKRQIFMINLAYAYLEKKDYPTALAVIKQAYDLAPNSQDLRNRYAQMAIYAGQDHLAEQLAGGQLILDDGFIKAYQAVGKFDKVLAIVKQRVALNPGDPQAHFSLSAAYLQSGDRQQAVAELETTKRLAPQAAGMVDYYIGEIKAGRNPR